MFDPNKSPHWMTVDSCDIYIFTFDHFSANDIICSVFFSFVRLKKNVIIEHKLCVLFLFIPTCNIINDCL